MGYIDENLISGEKILYRTRLHWIVMIVPILAGLFLDLIGITCLIGSRTNATKSIPATGMVGIGLLFLIGGAVIISWGFWHRSSTEMAVTNKHVLIKVGMVSRNTTEMMLSKIESVNVHQSILGRMLNFGTITVRGTGGTPEPFPKIGHPVEFRRQVQQELDKLSVGAAANSAG